MAYFLMESKNTAKRTFTLVARMTGVARQRSQTRTSSLTVSSRPQPVSQESASQEITCLVLAPTPFPDWHGVPLPAEAPNRARPSSHLHQ